MKDSRKRLDRTEVVKVKSGHKHINESPNRLKQKSITGQDQKKLKAKKLLKSSSKSIPKIKIKGPKDRTFCNSSFDQQEGFEEYFVFENRIVPIVNSDERRAVNRYFWTSDLLDKQNKDFADNSTACTGFVRKPETRDTAVMTSDRPKPTTKEQSIQIKTHTETKNQDTMTLVQVSKKPGKSFQQVLNQLQFLYLPNNKHFDQLTPVEKEHYRELFLVMANKLAVIDKVANAIHQGVPQYNINEFVAFNVQRRISQQVDCLDIEIQKGIPTNLLCILSYLSNLFCFIEVQYREHLLRGLNTPYGYYNQQRFALLVRGKPLTRVQSILPESVYAQLESEFFAEDESLDEATVQYMHIHNRAIFDHLNDELNLFRPFYSCNGQPYSWFIPGKITFFSIGQDDIELVLQKAKVKILESASLLCGIHCDPMAPFTRTNINESAVLKDIREQRQKKLIFNEIYSIDQSVDIEDYRTKLILEITQTLYDQILFEANEEFGQFFGGDSFYVPVFEFVSD